MMLPMPISWRTAVLPSSKRAEALSQQLRWKYSLGFIVRLERKSPSLPLVCFTDARTSIISRREGTQNSLTSVRQYLSLGNFSNTPPKIRCQRGRAAHQLNSTRKTPMAPGSEKS